MKSLLYVRLPVKKIYPAGIVYLADYVHKHRPHLKQRILDLALVKDREEEKILLETIGEVDPEVIAFSWRDIQPFSPDEDDEAFRNAFKFYFSPNLLAKSQAALRGIKMILSYDNRIRRNLSLILAANRDFPNKKILIGGSAFSVFASTLIKKCPEGTIGVIGEGENVLIKLIDGKSVLDERVIIKKNGAIIAGKPGQYVKIEEGTPVDFDYICSIFPDFMKYTDGYVGVQTKRGCPYGCLFCLYNFIDGKKVRFRRPKVIAAEMESLVKNYGVKSIWFVDSQFYPSPQSESIVEETLDEIIRRDLQLKWSSYLRIDRLTPSLAKKMLDSGISDFELSITSGSQKVVDVLRLGFKLEQFLSACQLLKGAGYGGQPIKLNLSLNAPGETEETLLETIKTVKKIGDIFGTGNVRPFVFFLAVQPNTGLAKIAIEQGYLPANFNPLALNPFIIKNLIYNPPPLGRMIAQACLKALEKKNTDIGWQVLSDLEDQLK